jgi:Rod binding domain-containing protein
VIGVGGLTAAGALDADLRGPKQGAENAKIDSSAREFESLLLSSWLQEAYQSFGSVPGTDEDQDLDSGKEQFQSIAMQSLGSSMAAAGGIGIARMISEHLHRNLNPAETGSDGSAPSGRTSIFRQKGGYRLK